MIFRKRKLSLEDMEKAKEGTSLSETKGGNNYIKNYYSEGKNFVSSVVVLTPESRIDLCPFYQTARVYNQNRDLIEKRIWKLHDETNLCSSPKIIKYSPPGSFFGKRFA